MAGAAACVGGLACFAFSQSALAVTPAPDGGYSGGNTAEGDNALFSLTSGGQNTALGFSALYSDTSGSSNTATGFVALGNNTTGTQNTAFGWETLTQNTTGIQNSADGFAALFSNTTGSRNMAMGFESLFSNTTGQNNAAIGIVSLYSNTTGEGNVAIGNFALSTNFRPNYNTAIGFEALLNNVGGGTPSNIGIPNEYGPNVAVGAFALMSNTNGGANTAVGYFALGSFTQGDDFFDKGHSTAVGFKALANSNGGHNDAFGDKALFNNAGDGTFACCNTAIGGAALYNNISGEGNVALGSGAGFNSTGSHNVYIGMAGVADESNACYIASISGQTSASGVAVLINSSGKLGTITSSKRFKDDIKPMNKASEMLFALKPVTFRYKKELDPQGLQQFGLVAEEVEKVDRDLVAFDKEGKPYAVRYEQVNAMLLNEFLKEHHEFVKEHQKVEQQDRKLKEQDATIAQQQKEIKALAAGLKKQAEQIQNVNAKLEMNRPAPRLVDSNQ